MSAAYKAVGWNAFKKRHDKMLVLGVVLFIALFVGISMAVQPKFTLEILLIRAFAVAAMVLLHVILMIGPLARLNSRWLPLLYNRRHLGVTMFLLALIHAALAIITYHVGSDMNPIVSIFTSDLGTRMTAIPFQVFGFVALLILFVMAATSHDFWLANLTAPIWKTLHMGVYVAYVLLVAHVAFGVLQSETATLYAVLMGISVITLAGLHFVTGWRQRGLEKEASAAINDPDFVEVCQVADLEENIPLGACVSSERVAVILYEGNKISCVSGVCQHQNGPLAEGQFKYGCLTCPWHGYQYKPHDGTSPEPFTEKIPTFKVKIVNGAVLVHKIPNAAGTAVEPALI